MNFIRPKCMFEWSETDFSKVSKCNKVFFGSAGGKDVPRVSEVGSVYKVDRLGQNMNLTPLGGFLSMEDDGSLDPKTVKTVNNVCSVFKKHCKEDELPWQMASLLGHKATIYTLKEESVAYVDIEAVGRLPRADGESRVVTCPVTAKSISECHWAKDYAKSVF